jgi:hypothetical protein
MNIDKVIEGLINSESKVMNEHSVIVGKAWVDELKKHLKAQKDSQKKKQEEEFLKTRREKVAQDEFENSDLDGLECMDSDNWVTDGDYRNLKFYYKDKENPKGDSKVATFVVVFEDGTDEIIDSHVNVW